MTKTAALLDDEIRSALANADYFVVSLFHNRAHETHPLKSLALARQAAAMLPKVRGTSRKAIVYAITASGQSVMVPDTFLA